jgi:peptidoglycan/xylan/chitin deacetylase (PgdA/CDA1 family)
MPNQPDPAVGTATLHGLRGPRGSRLDDFFLSGDHVLGGLRPVVAALPVITTAVEADGPALTRATEGLGEGPAVAEAVAIRLRRQGFVMVYAKTGPRVSRRELLDLSRARGRDAVRVLRADPCLLPEVQVGSWWVAGWRARWARAVLLSLPAMVDPLTGRMAAEVAFWRGVRDAASRELWRRLTKSSYVVLCYHRIAGRFESGQERMDVAPAAFDRQVRLLRRCGWRPLTPAQLISLHEVPDAVLPRRRYVITVDDGFADAVRALEGHGGEHPQLFAVTGSVGGTADWLGEVGVADWDALRRFQAGGGHVGSHARRHVPLDELTGAQLQDELSGSLADLRAAVRVGEPLLAYPHGRHSLEVRARARQAGYRLAYTTKQGRNGPGTDRWCLRRVEPKAWDSTASFLWKVVTGESPPGRWERRLERRWQAAQLDSSAGRPSPAVGGGGG